MVPKCLSTIPTRRVVLWWYFSVNNKLVYQIQLGSQVEMRWTELLNNQFSPDHISSSEDVAILHATVVSIKYQRYVSRADRYYDGSRALSSVKPRWFFNILAYIEQLLTKDEWNPIKVKANNMNSWAILKRYCTIDDLSCVPDLLHLLARWINDRLPLSSGMNACGTFGLRFLSSNSLEN